MAISFSAVMAVPHPSIVFQYSFKNIKAKMEKYKCNKKSRSGGNSVRSFWLLSGPAMKV